MSTSVSSRLRAKLDRSNALDRVAAVGAFRPLSWMNALDAIALVYGTDKSSRYHGYTRWYRRHFRSLRSKRITLIEIGVGGDEDPHAGGRSLRMWHDYLRRARIYGVDLYEKQIAGLGRRVELIQADQSSSDDLAAVLERVGTPDVVIDDGSHVGEHVWCSFEALFPALRLGGWYVIEDLQTSFLSGFGSEERRPIGVALEAALATQDLEPKFRSQGRSSGSVLGGSIERVHVYPGIAFIRKATA